MNKFKLKKNVSLISAVILYILLLSAVIILMRYVQNLIDSDAKINLTEVVTQNKDVITSKLNLEVNSLESSANQIADRLSNSDTDSLKTVFQQYSEDNNDDKVFLAQLDGTAFFADGETLDISGRKYFKLSSKGIQNISDRVVSRQDGEEIFIISIPLNYKGNTIGTLQKMYSLEEMYKLCSISLFSSEGYMYIINSEGYILISSRHDEYSKESENYYRMIYAQGNRDKVKQLQNDVKKNHSGFMETVIDDKKTFSVYTPIEGLHDWYLISSVTTNAVSPNGNIVVKIFYSILFFVTFVFGTSLFFFLSYKNKQQANLKCIAFVDNVTQGSTYTKFMVDLHDILYEHPEIQYYLLKFDIDNFKYVNNFYGFDFGDRILYQINQRISSKLKPDETIARISSDHFIVLLKDISEDRLYDLLSCMEGEKDLSIYFSAGIYAIQNIDESINLMVDKAGLAAAKSKNSLHKKIEMYTDSFDQQMIKNEQLKLAIKQALVDDEIIPFYQPKININTGKLVGAEALARWRNKDGKLIPPNEFIPLCEKIGLVTELDMVIYEKVLKFIKSNIDAGTTCIPISINFSRLHLLDKDFMKKLMEKIHQYEIPTNLIEIELTESVIFDNVNTVVEFITNLHNEGFLVSMDDFGSGYSSLNMLKDIPIDILKIDRAFLQNTTDSNRQKIIFSAITQMATQLSIKVVAEGVETIENVELMKELGCYVAQGYYFAKPMDEKLFEKIYKEGIIC